ncbi:MAG: AAA family ATPase [Syntrophobacteraceae bacterium]
MYLDFYKFKKSPFHITPDPEFLFLSASHKEASACLIYGIEERKGFIAITGEIGVGKTTILRSYLENIEPEKLRVVYIFNAVLSFESLLKQIFNELGLVAAEGTGVPGLVNHLHRFLIEEYKNERNVALIIDEAQNMPVETLENLRMLSNLETSKDKLVQIVMVGQPEFERKLELEELRQLKQRVAIRCRIKPLTRDESLAYIQHRLMKASLFHNQVFTKGALKRIVKEAGGFPRLINIFCDNAMITGFGYQRNPVGKKIIKEVIADFRGGKLRRTSRVWPIAAVCTGITLFCFLFTKPLENRVSQETPRVPGKEQVKLVPLPAPSVDLPVRKSVPVSEETSSAQQQVSVSGPSKEMETVPEIRETPPPEKQHVGEESAAKSANVPEQEPPLITVPSDHPKEKGPLKRIVIKGDSVSRVLVDTYGYCDPVLMHLFKEANPQIKDLNKISVGVQLQLPHLDSSKSQPW